jgi:hypothetical protein
VVLPDPGLVVAELVELLQEIKIAPQREGWVFAAAMERRHEYAEVESLWWHFASPLVTARSVSQAT